MSDEPKLIHRDDLDIDQAEPIVAKMQEMFPGCTISFAGDLPAGKLPGELKEAVAAIEHANHESMITGTCIDCGAKMPNYDMSLDGWQPAEGWTWFSEIGTDMPVAWQCPACDEKDA